MASSRVQKQCEVWIVENWLPSQFGQQFFERRMQMQDRGFFEFDAVSEDEKIVGNVSTATAYTHRGAVASGKKSKIRADCLMLSLVQAEHKLLLLTEPCMTELSQKEQAQGRLPLDIEVVHVDLPRELKQALHSARITASKEVRGNA